MTVDELRSALKSGVTLLWQGPRDYERATGSLTGLIERKGGVFSCELTSISATSGRHSVVICRPEELSFWNPKEVIHNGGG